MYKKQRILWITRTAIFIALLIVMQLATAPLGNPLVTGSIVNFLLIVSVMTCGVASGLSVAVVSPIMAKLLGIGPFWSLIPFIILGNVVLVLLWYAIGNFKKGRKLFGRIIALVAAAFAKSIVLYIGIVKIAIPVMLKLPDQQAMAISNMFSFSQLITATVGGAVALLILPVLRKAINIHEKRDYSHDKIDNSL